MVKTRVMNRDPTSGISNSQLILGMARKEGPTAFYKGASANLARQASWITVMFVTLEQIKGMFSKYTESD